MNVCQWRGTLYMYAPQSKSAPTGRILKREVPIRPVSCEKKVETSGNLNHQR
jgi:hypothetical protein